MTDNNHFGEVFDSENWAGRDYRGHKFYMCQLNHVEIKPDTNLYGATFFGCGATFLEAQCKDFDHVSFDACDLRHGNFQGSKWTRSRIHSSNLMWAHFGDADLRDLSGENSDFYLSRVQKAKRLNPFDRDMISEIVRVNAAGDLDTLSIAALVKSSKDLCWRDFKNLSKTPYWKHVGDVIYPIFESYPSITEVIQDGVIQGE